MTEPEWQPLPRDLVNPFNPAGVAYVALDGPSPVTVRNRDGEEVLTLLHRYLRNTSAETRAPDAVSDSTAHSGDVVAIVGDYGMGKTHLCVDLVRAAAAEPRTVTMYLDAQTPSFPALHRKLAAKFSQAEITGRVRRYYALATADLLALEPATVPLAREVREGRLKPQRLVRELDLPEAKIVEAARLRMARVTDQTEFATALSLLLRPGFEASAWQWLTGGFPDDLLRERGVVRPIDDDVRALEAIGVLALLHNQPGQRFVLVIDELQQVLYGVVRPHHETEQAFKALLSVCVNAGAFLVLSGVSGILDAMAEDVRERIATTIELHRLEEAQVAELVERTVRPVTGRPGSDPFTREAVGRVADLTGGLPRAVSRLCHHAFARSKDVGAPVTAEMVQEIAGNVLGGSTIDSVRNHLDRILSWQSWEHRRSLRHWRAQTVVDHVVYLAGGRVCDILVVEAAMSRDGLEQLAGRVESLRAEGPDAAILLVVHGRSATVQTDRLRLLIGSDPLPYQPGTFAVDLVARLREMERQASAESPVPGLADAADAELSRLRRQQFDAQHSLDKVTALLEEFRAESRGEFENVRRVLRWARGSRPPGAPVAGSTATGGGAVTEIGPGQGNAPVAAAGLPPTVQVLFDDALQALAEVPDIGEVFQGTFVRAAREPDGRPALSPELHRALRSAETAQALSVSAQLRALVGGFRDAVQAWFLDLPVDRERALRAVCLAFDSVYTAIAVNQLDGARYFARDGASVRVDQVREVLDRLGTFVEQRALDAVARS